MTRCAPPPQAAGRNCERCVRARRCHEVSPLAGGDRVSNHGNVKISTAKVRVGSAVPVVPGASWLGEDTRGAVRAVAAAGLDHLMVADHVSFFGGAGVDGLIAAASALGCQPDLPVYVAVYQLFLRHPVVVARQLADLALIAPGRLTLGVGLGGEDRHESEVCGVSPATRGRRTDECLEVLDRLLAGHSVSFEGREIRLNDAVIRPTPTARIPLVIGGRSDAALRRAARFGDGWIGIWISASRFAQAVGEVEQQAAGHGREVREWSHALNVWCGLDQDRAAATKAVSDGMQAFYHLPYESFARWSPAGTPADVAEFLAPYIEAGCSNFNLIPCGTDSGETASLAGEVRRLLATA